MNSNSGIMKKIVYVNEPVYDDPEKYRDYIKKANEFSCAYCTITESESSGATFNLDHFRPKKLFPQYYSTCNNLRYSCPRCNSYKRARWIEEKNGCIRNCELCKNKVCDKNVERFVDNLKEDPADIFVIDDEGYLYSANNSKPADYTIKYLRLNRSQLIKLRKIRRYIDLWREELVELKANVSAQKINVLDNKKKFENLKSGTILEGRNGRLAEIVSKMFEMLELQLEQEECIIDEQIRKIDSLLINEYESDSVLK